MCKGTANAIFVESNLLWRIILKVTYALPSTTTKFYYFCLYIPHVSVMMIIPRHLNTLLKNRK